MFIDGSIPISVGRTQRMIPQRTRLIEASQPGPTGVYTHPVGGRLDDRWLYFNPPPEHRTTAWANHPHNLLRSS